MTSAVAAANLGRVFGTGSVAVRALSSVDLEIATGEFVVFLGPSGSGKTTLLNLVGAIDTPTEGGLVVDGIDITRLDDNERTDFRRGHVGFVFQFFNLIPTLTALENVELIAELTDGDGAVRARRALEIVGLQTRFNSFPAALSGGEQQRVAIARAVAKAPSILLADEPTGALDLETGRVVLDYIHRLNRDRNLTVLLVTHNVVVADMADRVVRLRDGRVVDDHRVSQPVAATALQW
ncbi:MAG: ABC transporter ATP-binding protein [Acidimicrobiia bacterium]